MAGKDQVSEEVQQIMGSKSFKDFLAMWKKSMLPSIIESAKEPPFLKNFHFQFRMRVSQTLKETFPKIWEEHQKMMQETQHEVCYSEFLPASFTQVLIQEVDVHFDSVAESTMERLKEQAEGQGNCFQDLKLSAKMMNMIPKDPDLREHAYELFLKWLIKIEKNVDMMQRAYLYGYIRDDVNSDYLKKLYECSMPTTVLFKNSLNSFMGIVVDKIIEKTFFKSMDTITSKLSTALLSFILASLFGGTVIAIGGVVISLVDLPFEVNLNIAKPLLEPLIDRVKLMMNIGNRDVFQFLLREVISDTEEANRELEALIQGIARLSFMDIRQVHLLQSLKMKVADILKGRRKKSNCRKKASDDDLLVVREAGFGSSLFDTIETFENAVVVEPTGDDDDFFEVKLKDGYKFLNNDEELLAQVIDIDDSKPAPPARTEVRNPTSQPVTKPQHFEKDKNSRHSQEHELKTHKEHATEVKDKDVHVKPSLVSKDKAGEPFSRSENPYMSPKEEVPPKHQKSESNSQLSNNDWMAPKIFDDSIDSQFTNMNNANPRKTSKLSGKSGRTNQFASGESDSENESKTTVSNKQFAR